MEMTVAPGGSTGLPTATRPSSVIGVIRLDLLPAQGVLQGGEHPGRSDDELRSARARCGDKRCHRAREAISSAGKTLRLMGLFADMGEGQGLELGEVQPFRVAGPRLRSRRWISRSVPTAFAVPRSRRSVNWWSGPTISSTSPTLAEEPRRGDGEARRARLSLADAGGNH